VRLRRCGGIAGIIRSMAMCDRADAGDPKAQAWIEQMWRQRREQAAVLRLRERKKQRQAWAARMRERNPEPE